MQTIKTILLILLYLTPAIGVNGSVHYCGGEIASITVNGIEESEKCGCDKESMSDNCCKEKGFSYKINDERCKVPVLSSINVFQYSDIILPNYSTSFTRNFSQKVESYISHQPPDNVKLKSIYILNRVFRI